MYSSTTIIGNLSKDISLTYVPSGTAVAKTSIAYSDGFGENKKTHFIDVAAWGKTAEAFNNYCKKGSKVLLVGVVQLEQWTAQDGSNRSKHSLRVDTMKMLDGKSDGQKNMQDAPSGGGEYINQNGIRQSTVPITQNGQPYIPEIDIDEDEIPFKEV